MTRDNKLKILEAVKSGLSIEMAMKALSDNHTVLFQKQDYYTTGLDGGEKISQKEGDLLLKHFPESVFISPITGISYDKE